MAHLSTLSNELLESIFGHFAHDNHTLCTLAVVNRHFSAIVREQLIRHLMICFKDPLAGVEKIKHILRKLSSSPELGNQVRSVDLTLVRRPSIPCMENYPVSAKMVDSWVDTLLAATPNLQRYEIHSNMPLSYRLSVPNFLTKSLADRIQDLVIRARQLSIDETTTLLLLPNLRILRIYPEKVAHQLRSEKDRDERLMARLEVFDLGRMPNLSPTALRLLLSLPQSVKALCCAPPGIFADMRRRRQTLAPFSPSDLNFALEPLKNSLVCLQVEGFHLARWPGHDGSRLDMTTFTKLEILEVPETYFFDIESKGWARRLRLWALLPAALRKLMVRGSVMMSPRQETLMSWRLST